MKLTDLDIIVTAPPAPGWGWALLDPDQADNQQWDRWLGRMLCLECGSKGDGSGHSRRL